MLFKSALQRLRTPSTGVPEREKRSSDKGSGDGRSGPAQASGPSGTAGSGGGVQLLPVGGASVQLLPAGSQPWDGAGPRTTSGTERTSKPVNLAQVGLRAPSGGARGPSGARDYARPGCGACCRPGGASAAPRCGARRVIAATGPPAHPHPAPAPPQLKDILQQLTAVNTNPTIGLAEAAELLCTHLGVALVRCAPPRPAASCRASPPTT
jgi:hypothetical protein